MDINNFNRDAAAYDLFDALSDMLEEYEYDTECHERCGMDTHSQRDIILRARNALNKFTPGHITDPPYWEDDDS
jgi:hypothetical protein